MQVVEVGPSLRWASVKVTKVARDQGLSGGTWNEDPWATQAPQGPPDEPPF